jgi:hypothetical protein
MSEPDKPATISLCNAGAADLQIWLEPWCDEFVLPSRAELSLHIDAEEGVAWEPELEETEHGLTIYGAGLTRIRVSISGIEQDSGSAVLTAPDFGGLGSRGLVDVVFGNFPEARPRGAPAPKRRGWFGRLFGNE